MKLPRFLKRKEKPGKQRVAVSLTQEGVAIAYSEDGSKHAEVKACAFLPCSLEQQSSVLADWIRKNDIADCQCTWVLDNEDYNLLQIEKLNVPEAELTEAARWRIRDLVQYADDDLLIDVFQIPAPQNYQQAKKMFVVASSKQRLQDGRDVIENAGLRVSYIDIRELALCALVRRAIGEGDCGALLMPGGSQSQLMMMKNNDLCLTRELSTSVSLQSDAESLAHELKRTFEYFDYDLGQNVQPKQIIIAPHTDVTHEYAKRMAQLLKKRVSILNLPALSSALEKLSSEAQQRCIGVVAGSIEGHGANN